MHRSEHPSKPLKSRSLDHLFRILSRREQALRRLQAGEGSLAWAIGLGPLTASRELDRIRSARGRFAAGHYGLCIECAAPIAYDRLEAQPHAERCEACEPASGSGPAK